MQDSNKLEDSSSDDPFITGLDNRYVSESVDEIHDNKIELTEEQIKELKEKALLLKSSGNDSFKETSNDSTPYPPLLRISYRLRKSYNTVQ
jgi:hypothetical protein